MDVWVGQGRGGVIVATGDFAHGDGLPYWSRFNPPWLSGTGGFTRTASPSWWAPRRPVSLSRNQRAISSLAVFGGVRPVDDVAAYGDAIVATNGAGFGPSRGLVAPMTLRAAAMTPSPSHTIATTGPEVINSTNPAKKGLSLWTA